jgi:predicted transcriptional regulator
MGVLAKWVMEAGAIMPVVENTKPIGIVTWRDVMLAIEETKKKTDR